METNLSHTKRGQVDVKFCALSEANRIMIIQVFLLCLIDRYQCCLGYLVGASPTFRIPYFRKTVVNNRNTFAEYGHLHALSNATILIYIEATGDRFLL